MSWAFQTELQSTRIFSHQSTWCPNKYRKCSSPRLGALPQRVAQRSERGRHRWTRSETSDIMGTSSVLVTTSKALVTSSDALVVTETRRCPEIRAHSHGETPIDPEH